MVRLLIFVSPQELYEVLEIKPFFDLLLVKDVQQPLHAFLRGVVMVLAEGGEPCLSLFGHILLHQLQLVRGALGPCQTHAHGQCKMLSFDIHNFLLHFFLLVLAFLFSTVRPLLRFRVFKLLVLLVCYLLKLLKRPFLVALRSALQAHWVVPFRCGSVRIRSLQILLRGICRHSCV